MSEYDLARCVKALELSGELLIDHAQALVMAEANTDEGRARARQAVAGAIRTIGQKLERISEHIEASATPATGTIKTSNTGKDEP